MASGARLAKVLRYFDVPILPGGQQDAKALEKALRQAYLNLAKDKHPDRQAQERKAQAEKEFVVLKTHYEDANALLRQGVLPYVPIHGQHPMPSYTGGLGERHQTPPGAPGWYSVEPEPPPAPKLEFDTTTRVKGWSVVILGGYIFWIGLREFLAGTAGSTWAWHPPNPKNIFRRHGDEFSEDKDKDRPKQEELTKIAARLQSEGRASTLQRSESSFYAKRAKKVSLDRGKGTSSGARDGRTPEEWRRSLRSQSQDDATSAESEHKRSSTEQSSVVKGMN